jgi:hypothetical protein
LVAARIERILAILLPQISITIRGFALLVDHR